MLKPLHLLLESLRQFVIGLGPAIVMALVCLAIQVFSGTIYIDRWSATSSPDLIGHTAGVSMFFYFHALVALILTAWLLRRPAAVEWPRLLLRAARGAVLVTCAAAVVFAAGYFVDDVLPATRYVRFDFTAAAMVAVWFGASALLLPARLMGHEPVMASGFAGNTLVAGIALVPWFYASEIVGAPLRHCRDCAGVLDGGLLIYPLIGAYLLGLTASSAAVSAAACMPASMPNDKPRATAFAALALAVIATWNAAAQPLTQKFDSIAKENLAQDRAVGAVVVVVKSNETLFFRTYGKMDSAPCRTSARSAGMPLCRPRRCTSASNGILSSFPRAARRSTATPRTGCCISSSKRGAG